MPARRFFLSLILVAAMTGDGMARAVACFDDTPTATPLGTLPLLSALAVLLMAMVAVCRQNVEGSSTALLIVSIAWIAVLGGIAGNDYIEALFLCASERSSRLNLPAFIVVAVATVLLLGLTRGIAVASRYAFHRLRR